MAPIKVLYVFATVICAAFVVHGADVMSAKVEYLVVSFIKVKLMCYKSTTIYIDHPLTTYFSHNVVFKPKPGAPPFLVLLDGEEEEIERIDLSKLNREECNELVTGLGFYKKTSREGEVPEEYQTGPYVPVKKPEEGLDDEL
ncbi:Selenoprotein M [Holothuria leucospilota]|uniref:Selenoprotein M n=1 Tax=Holothuria leucospilota TaxID=206669 RepID=A0A9Q1CBU8_HOLLE|nr:Selenoprotein M [Holothuria leucospilota]